MADIISGKSRFNGDRDAPVKKVIPLNTEIAATEEQDDIQIKEKIRRHRIRVAVFAGLSTVVLVLAFFVVKRAMDNYSYTTYTVINSMNREDLESSRYAAFGDGYVRYSNDGVSYFNSNGSAIWNQTFSMQNPQIKICDSSLAVGDINGNTLYTFNESGPICAIDTSMPILQIEVAKHGVVAAVLEDNEANYINMYDKDGEKIYSVKTTLAGDGYPLDISISENATKLVASYIYVSGEEIKTNVVFYNFSEVGQNETERVVGGFNHYNDTLVGDVQFVNSNMVVAVGENVLSLYKIKEYPSLEKEIEINSEIESVFYGSQYVGLVLHNSDSGDLYRLVVYNLSGGKVCETTFGTQYDNIQFDGRSIVLNSATTFLLMNLRGKVLADLNFDMPISEVLTTGVRGSYILVNSKYIQNIKLR